MKAFLLQERSRVGARKMVYLDREARRAVDAGDMVRAAELWVTRAYCNRYVRRDVDIDHPDFGKAHPCPRCNN